MNIKKIILQSIGINVIIMAFTFLALSTNADVYNDNNITFENGEEAKKLHDEAGNIRIVTDEKQIAYYNENVTIEDADKDISKKNIDKIACDYANKFIDIKKYCITIEGNMKLGYTYIYTKYLGDYKTNDYFFVEINQTGEIVSYAIQNTGVYDEYEDVIINQEYLNQQMDMVINSHYSHYTYTYEIVDQILYLDQEGQLMLSFSFYAKINAKEGEDTYNDTIEIPIGEKCLIK